MTLEYSVDLIRRKSKAVWIADARSADWSGFCKTERSDFQSDDLIFVARFVPTSEQMIVGSLFPATIRSKQGRSNEAIDEITFLIVCKECGPERSWKQEIDGSMITVTA